MSEPTALFIGSPGAGKSNYLFRLWLALRDDRQRTIMRDGNPAELQYLNDGVSRQLAGQFADHTSMGVRERIAIPLKVNGVPASLTVPDRPGEDWKKFYERRRFPTDWLDLIHDTTSCLVFVPAVGTDAPHDWMTIQRFQGAGANLGTNADLRDAPPPTQMVLADTIQLLQAQFRQSVGPAHVPRIGIVITAWDMLPAEQQAGGPLQHLRTEHKLLYDFITANRERFAIEAFGITLYGGDLNDPEFTKDFGDKHPRERGEVWHQLNGAVECSDDLVLPIAWALSAGT
ncbi:hypothetical protein [Sphingomonas cavernae]|uniref:Double-GTPase 1 domain-containing protein n=1 Tax=Sphingomonas cavernae TaxID=2320861 RepID=A0A418W7Y4_9SPHN|nr:hypothetical protein [Sphingomonas cavernae]RJF86111.1 hypothetical protein D3876_20055 [Sphingomonas cavernae]